MAGRKVGQYVVDWVKIGSKVPKVARAELAGFRSRHETIKTKYVLILCSSVHGHLTGLARFFI